MTQPTHVPVMVDRVVALVAPALERPGAVLVDATIGLGGHAAAILARCPQARVVGLDRDPDALATARTRLAAEAGRVTLVHAVYDQLPEVLRRLGLAHVNGVVFDLGLSSLQIDERRRGFAYAEDSPLDMRMDQGGGVTAAEVVNTYSADDLARVLRTFGEERFARRIADGIVRERAAAPFDSSARLVEVVRAAIPASKRESGGHPAKRTFQALRIEVNDELSSLARALPAAIGALAVRGRIVVLAYHSLEDRLVKQTFTAGSQAGVPVGVPIVPADHAPTLRLLTRGAERPEDDEVAANARARSVRLRAAERIRAAA